MAEGGFGTSDRDSDSRSRCYSIFVTPTSSSPPFDRRDLWNHCAHSYHLELSNPSDHGRHGVEEVADGWYRINFAHESDRKEAVKKLQGEPLWMKVAPLIQKQDTGEVRERRGGWRGDEVCRRGREGGREGGKEREREEEEQEEQFIWILQGRERGSGERERPILGSALPFALDTLPHAFFF